MTEAERFQKAMRAILSVPPERAEEINRQTRQEYEKRKASEDRRSDSKGAPGPSKLSKYNDGERRS